MMVDGASAEDYLKATSTGDSTTLVITDDMVNEDGMEKCLWKFNNQLSCMRF
jgi:hypothetical protein